MFILTRPPINITINLEYALCPLYQELGPDAEYDEASQFVDQLKALFRDKHGKNIENILQ